jgi:polyferredoxin
MINRVIADGVVALHFVFIVFVVGGGLLGLWRRASVFLHLPALAWGAWAAFTGSICPLTPLENAFRRAAGEAGYPGGFVEHYLIPLIYPEALTPRTQMGYGAIVLAINAVVYAFVWRSWRRRSSGRSV